MASVAPPPPDPVLDALDRASIGEEGASPEDPAELERRATNPTSGVPRAQGQRMVEGLRRKAG